MNKKELLQRLGWLRYDSKIKDSRYKFYNKAVNTAISVAERLDEPEKPLVPQVVVDWYEKHKDNLSKNLIYFICDYGNDLYEDDIAEKFANWFSNNEDTALYTLVKMKLYDYTVDKDTLYEVFLKKNGAQLGAIVPSSENKSQFTYEELRACGFTNLDIYEVKEVKND